MDGSDSVRVYANVCKCMHSAATSLWPLTGRTASENMLMYANVCTVCSNVVVAMNGSDSVREYVDVC